jgi:polyketide synthase 12/myxalamid-type polyketide synthase MxaF
VRTSISTEQSQDGVQGWLLSTLAEQLGIDPRAIDVCERFSRYGLDSMGATRLLGKLAEMLGRPLSPTLVWEYPTIEALARHLTAGADGEPKAPASTPPTMREDEPVAVIRNGLPLAEGTDPRCLLAAAS